MIQDKQQMKLYCKECNEDLTIHADKSIACGCQLQRAGEPIPADWVYSTGDSVEAETLNNWREFTELGA